MHAEERRKRATGHGQSPWNEPVEGLAGRGGPSRGRGRPWWRRPVTLAVCMLLLLPLVYSVAVRGRLPQSWGDPAVLAVAAAVLTAALGEGDELRRRLWHRLRTDRLTGLGNRRRFHADLEAAMASARLAGTPLIVALLAVERSAQGARDDVSPRDLLRVAGRSLPGRLRSGLETCYRAGRGRLAIIAQVRHAAEARNVTKRLLGLPAEMGVLARLGCLLRVGCAVTSTGDTARSLTRRAEAHLSDAKRRSAEPTVRRDSDPASLAALHPPRAARPATPAGSVEAPGLAPEGPTASDVHPSVPRPRRIALAEDNDAMRSLVASFLVEEGYTVVSCRTGDELLGLLTRAGTAPDAAPEHIDLVVSDIRMPGLLGSEVVRYLHVRGMPTPPVILMTAFGDDDVRADAERLGCAALLDKPFELGELLEVIHGLAHPKAA